MLSAKRLAAGICASLVLNARVHVQAPIVFAGGTSGWRLATHDAAVQMIDTSIVRVRQHGACIARNNDQHMGRSRGALIARFSRAKLNPRTVLLADRGYDAGCFRALVSERGVGKYPAVTKSQRNDLFHPVSEPSA
jgi:hypothetical protein